jgi:phosphatidylglycerol:prolipoprotein diacylglycerol transferase
VLAEIDILGLEVKTFGLFFALNFLAWAAVTARRLRELGHPVDWAYEMLFAALGGGLVGAKLYWAIQNGQLELGELLSGSGLVWYGGLIGGALAVLAWARWRGWLGLELLDTCAVALALGYAVGRIGCQVAGDGDYGEPSGLPWAMPYPDGVVPTDQEVHPTPIYEALTMGLVAWWPWRMRDELRAGALFALYLVLAGTARFLVEFVRLNDVAAAGLTAPQLESLALMVAGAVWLGRLARSGGIRRPAAAPARA